MSELELKIKNYADKYYKDGSSPISDEEFDALIEKLRIEQPDSELLKGPAGDDLAGVDKRYKLPHIMGTLRKVHTEKEFSDWFEAHRGNALVVTSKIDGNGVLLEYKEGKLTFIYSRGNTEYGLDLSHIAEPLKIPKNIQDFTGCIRGEVLMDKTTFLKYFKKYKNPRNVTAGILGRKNGEDLDKLRFIAYDVFADFVVTEKDKFDFLVKTGFEIPPIYEINPSYEWIINARNKLEPDGEIPVDGLVIKPLEVDKEDNEKRIPLNSVAFKPEAQIKVSTIRDIAWQLQGSQFAPVGIIDPVEIDGATVSRVTLNNVNKMEELNVRIGSMVEIIRSGMVIPKILKVLD